MRSQGILIKTVVTIGMSLVLFAPALASDDYNCTQLMYDHGLATSAQLNCGYESYSNAVISKAAQCMALAEQHDDSARLESVLKSGIADFQSEYDNASSKEGICSALASSLPMFVRP